MENEENEIFVSVKDEDLSQRRVNYMGYSATKFLGRVDKSTKARVFLKAEYIKFLRQDVHMNQRQAYRCFNALSDIGFIHEVDGKRYAVDREKAPFLKLRKDTVRYFFDHHTDSHFKVYCYLLNKYNLHEAYGHRENYFFSCAELLRAIGYNGRRFENVKLMNEVLMDLENNSFIRYSHEAVGRPGHRGRYRELYFVNPVAENSRKALGETVEQDKVAPRWFNGDTWHEYGILDFSNRSLVKIFLSYAERNRDAIRYAAERGDLMGWGE